VVRWRYGLLLIAYVAAFAHLYALSISDWLLVEYADRLGLHRPGYPGGWSGFLHIYSQMPKMQMGPPVLLAGMPTQLFLNPSDGNITAALVIMAAGVLCVALAERIARAAGVAAEITRPAALIGGALLLPLWADFAITFMRLDDAIVLIAMLLRGRWLPAGLLLGTAVATKPWAIVVVPIILALPRRDMVRAGVLAFGTLLLWWAPFFIADPAAPHALASVHVSIDPLSTFNLLGSVGRGHLRVCMNPTTCYPAPASWMRPVQLSVAFLLAVLAARRGRVWAVPLVGLCGRVLFDSQAWSYYGVGPVLAALAWDMSHGRRIPRWALFVLVGEYASYVIHNHVAVGVIRLVMCAVVIYWFALRRRSHPVPDSAELAVLEPRRVEAPVPA
jgi:hypothetical protein